MFVYVSHGWTSTEALLCNSSESDYYEYPFQRLVSLSLATCLHGRFIKTFLRLIKIINLWCEDQVIDTMTNGVPSSIRVHFFDFNTFEKLILDIHYMLAATLVHIIYILFFCSKVSQEFIQLVFQLKDLTISQLKTLWQEASFKCRNDWSVYQIPDCFHHDYCTCQLIKDISLNC